MRLLPDSAGLWSRATASMKCRLQRMCRSVCFQALGHSSPASREDLFMQQLPAIPSEKHYKFMEMTPSERLHLWTVSL